MGMIKLTNGFQVLPEGEAIFKITEVKYNEEFGKLEVKLITKDELTHTEKYNLLSADGSPNDGAYNAFSYFAKVAMNNMSLDEIDPETLVGHYFKATVIHEQIESKTNPGKMLTFVKLDNKEVADGFDGEAVKTANKAPVTSKANDIDLDDLLGF